jgi:D-cysteine desulfhydrase
MTNFFSVSTLEWPEAPAVELRIVRDDLFPFTGGGNKARKILFIEKEIQKAGANAIVTTGGINSNHCRVAAILAAQNQWDCTLVLHGEPPLSSALCPNLRLMRDSGAQIIFCDPAAISAEMDSAITRYESQGKKPFYLTGGGHTLAGGQAYIEAIAQLQQYCKNQNWYPDYIFLASGTGSTHAGILAGLDKYELKAKVVGISVARLQPRAEEIVGGFYKKLCSYFSISCNHRKVTVNDAYLCGGYEKFSDSLLELSNDSLKKFGFPLDVTYSGKAFYGMQHLIVQEGISGTILFWHTGGLLNYLS